MAVMIKNPILHLIAVMGVYCGCYHQTTVESFSYPITSYHSTFSSRRPTLTTKTTHPYQNGISSPSTFKMTSSSSTIPRIQNTDIQTLSRTGIVTIPQFIPPSLVSSLRRDVEFLRDKKKFKIAKIGQDATNTLNQDIRVAETVFIGSSKLTDVPSDARTTLYDILEQLRIDLSGNDMLDVVDSNDGSVVKGAPALDATLTETLYAYYPTGGFYRRHCDAVPNSASTLRCYSLLLYLNEDWKREDGGELRVHMDGGRDFLPPNESPNFTDIEPRGGTLVLFKSEQIPHEVLDTKATRAAVVGWYNRPVSMADISTLSSEEDKVRSAMLLVSGVLVVAGLVMVLTG